MGRIILITGGCRSGKSTFGISLAERDYARKVFLATAEALDAEMQERIKKHKGKRGSGWQTVEEPIEIAKVFKEHSQEADVILLDCITLWISNLMMKNWDTRKIFSYVDAMLKSTKSISPEVILITNEVGWGIVPANKLARDFRDIAGTVNQRIAGAAESVVLLVSGIPVCIKGNIDVNEY